MKKNTNIHVTARAVIMQSDHILLAYDPTIPNAHYYDLKGGVYYLPGGHVDHRESAHQALVREIKEEMDHDANITRFLGVLEHAWSFPGDEGCCHTHEINLIFEVELKDLSINSEIRQIEDHVKLQWFPFKELENVNFMPRELQILIPEWLSKRENQSFFASTIK